MLNPLGKFLLFLLAYVVIIDAMLYSLISRFLQLWLTVLIAVAVLAVIFISNFIMIRLFRKLGGTIKKVKVEENKNSDYLIFIVTFLLPLISLQGGALYYIVLFITFVMIYSIYVDTSVIAVNPFLKIFFHYNIYRAKLNNVTCYILSQKELEEVEIEMPLTPFSKNVYLSNMRSEGD